MRWRGKRSLPENQIQIWAWWHVCEPVMLLEMPDCLQNAEGGQMPPCPHFYAYGKVAAVNVGLVGVVLAVLATSLSFFLFSFFLSLSDWNVHRHACPLYLVAWEIVKRLHCNWINVGLLCSIMRRGEISAADLWRTVRKWRRILRNFYFRVASGRGGWNWSVGKRAMTHVKPQKSFRTLYLLLYRVSTFDQLL